MNLDPNNINYEDLINRIMEFINKNELIKNKVTYLITDYVRDIYVNHEHEIGFYDKVDEIVEIIYDLKPKFREYDALSGIKIKKLMAEINSKMTTNDRQEFKMFINQFTALSGLK